jgi:hypothetical protein
LKKAYAYTDYLAKLGMDTSSFKEKFAGFQHTFSPNEALFSDPFGL